MCPSTSCRVSGTPITVSTFSLGLHPPIQSVHALLDYSVCGAQLDLACTLTVIFNPRTIFNVLSRFHYSCGPSTSVKVGRLNGWDLAQPPWRQQGLWVLSTPNLFLLKVLSYYVLRMVLNLLRSEPSAASVATGWEGKCPSSPSLRLCSSYL